MSFISKKTVGIFLIGVVAFWWVWYTEKALAPDTSMPVPAHESVPAALIGSDTSDLGLEQDLTAIEAELTGLSADADKIDQGLSDEPIEQENL